MTEPELKMGGVGVFTPPPAPCGNPECHYVEFDVIHAENCEWEDDE